MSGALVMDKRVFSRVDYFIRALLETGRKSFEGTVLNLSLDGALVITPEIMVLHEEVTVTVFVDKETCIEHIKVSGKVVRLDHNAIAIQFHNMGLETLTKLKKVLEEKLIYEYLASITIK